MPLKVVAELLVDAALHRAFLRGERSLYSHLWVLEAEIKDALNIHTHIHLVYIILYYIILCYMI